MRRLIVDAFELFLERGERTVAFCGKFLNGDIVENVVLNYLFKLLDGGVDVPHYLGLYATIVTRGEKIYQFGHFEGLGGVVLIENILLDVGIYCMEKVFYHVPGRINHKIFVATVAARVNVGYVHIVAGTEF